MVIRLFQPRQPPERVADNKEGKDRMCPNIPESWVRTIPAVDDSGEERAELDRLFHGLRKLRASLQTSVPLSDRRAALDRWQPPVGTDVVVEPIDANGVRSESISIDPDATTDILYLHGGGYCYGGLANVREFVARVARASGARVLHPDYRLAPEHPFPAALEDARAAYDYLVSDRGAQRVVVVGDSAGGGLALSLLLSLRNEGYHPMPAAYVGMSPWVDLAMTSRSYVERAQRDPVEDVEILGWSVHAYCKAIGPDDPRVSPLYGDLAGLPPMLVLVGTEEVCFDDSIRLAEGASAAGVAVTLEIGTGMSHSYPRFALQLAAGQRAVERVGAYIRAAVATDGHGAAAEPLNII